MARLARITILLIFSMSMALTPCLSFAQDQPHKWLTDKEIDELAGDLARLAEELNEAFRAQIKTWTPEERAAAIQKLESQIAELKKWKSFIESNGNSETDDITH